jgi:uncharacterized protein with NRDE domain
MCLVAAALRASDRYPLLLCANRDERHARPSAPAGWWGDRPRIFGGRDLAAGGSWLAVDRRGRLAAVTNVREPGAPAAPRSRGELVADFLSDDRSIDELAADLARRGGEYAPFTLWLLDRGDLRCSSNRGPAVRLEAGVHALSNAPHGVEWPKVRSARAGVEALLRARDPIDGLLELLAQRTDAGPAEERYRSSHFVAGPVYGTRCSTVVLVDRDGTLTFVERSFDSAARVTGEVRESFATGT